MTFKNQEEINHLSKKFQDINNIYHNKCCSLLNKIKIYDIENNQLKEKNASLISEMTNMKKINDLNIENNTKLKVVIKEKEKEMNKLNIKINEIQNENNTLNDNLKNKIELVNKLKNNIKTNNSNIEDLSKKNNTLLKEIEEANSKFLCYKTQEQKKESLIKELNKKISSSNNEIYHKNDMINNLNNKLEKTQIKLNELEESKNKLLKLLNEKEYEIQEKNKEIVNLSNKYNSSLKLKEENIFKFNKKIKAQEKQIIYLTLKNSNDNINYEQKTILPSNKDKIDMSKIEIERLKEHNILLFREKLNLEENIVKLNMKYNVTKTMMNLGSQLIEEFNNYKLDNNKKDSYIAEDIIDSFLNVKIEKCNEEIKIIQNNISKKLIGKKNSIENLIDNIRIYKNKIKNSFNDNLLNLNECLKKLKENEGIDNGKENKILTQIIQELLDKYKECILYGKNHKNLTQIEVNNNDIDINKIKDVINNIKTFCQNKKEILNDIIPYIIKIINGLINMELKTINQINYYEYKILLEGEKKSTNSNEINILVEEYKNLNIIITDFKNKYTKLFYDFQSFKEKLEKDEFIYNNQLETGLISNGNEEISQESKFFDEENNENDEYDKKIINEINILKRDIYNKVNFLYELYNLNKNKSAYNKNTDIYNKYINEEIFINFNQQENEINELISKRDIIDKDIIKLKMDFLVLNTLPNQYMINKVFLINETLNSYNKILEDKLKLIFGQKFEVKNLYNKSKPEIIWNKSEIPKLSKEIMILREEKRQIEIDLNALKASFESTLNETGSDNQITILFRMKNENKNLKKEIQRIKEKNNILKQKLAEMNKNNTIYNLDKCNNENSNKKQFNESLLQNCLNLSEIYLNNNNDKNKNVSNCINNVIIKGKENKNKSSSIKKNILNTNYKHENTNLRKGNVSSKKKEEKFFQC